MDALADRDGLARQKAADIAEHMIEERRPAPSAPPRMPAAPGQLAPQTAAPVRPTAEGEQDDPMVRAARAFAANMTLGPRMAMAMAAMAPYPFAWAPPMWTAALTWSGTAQQAALAFAATHPVVAPRVLPSLAPPPDEERSQG